MCSAKLEAEEIAAGEKHSCPNCGQRLQIPAPRVNKTVLGKLENAPKIVTGSKETIGEASDGGRHRSAPEVLPAYEPGGSSNRIVAGVAAIIFGWFGLHHFLLGRVSLGIVSVCLVLLGLFNFCLHCWIPFFLVPWVFAIIDGVRYLSMTNKEFAATVLCPNAEETRRMRLRRFITAGTVVFYILSDALFILGFIIVVVSGG